jgi:hypothetical protein
LVSLETVSFLSFWPPAIVVLFLSNGFKMFRVAAQRFVAQMVDFKSFWNRPDQQLVDYAMCCFCPVINSDASVFEFGIRSPGGSNPHPATFDRVDPKFLLESFGESGNGIG